MKMLKFHLLAIFLFSNTVILGTAQGQAPNTAEPQRTVAFTATNMRTEGMVDSPQICTGSERDVDIGLVNGINGVFSTFEIELIQKVLQQTLVASEQRANSRLALADGNNANMPCTNPDCSPAPYRGKGFHGSVSMENGDIVDYSAVRGQIDWVIRAGEAGGTVDAYRFVSALAGDIDRNKHAKPGPLVPFILGWVAIQGGCIAQREHCGYTCGLRCPCGLASFDTVMCGMVSCKCNCAACPPQTPLPPVPPTWPGGPNGPWYTGLPWNFASGAPWIIDGDDPIGWIDPH